MPTSRKRVTARFDGHVQGVGFRFTTLELAKGLDITGYVMNQPDGSVELVAEGDEASLHTLLRRISGSQVGRFITSEKVFWSIGSGAWETFDVRYM